ncbi:MAG: asparagine synthase (glutamine-hydrolyzing), partial [Gammaproteobacteria bacterium]|nr:asparagine synthase (glutamine-hydrolyzing) [Gammaproteobacteria bacterium]
MSEAGKINEMEEVVSSMNSTLTHRGPDDKGLWIDNDEGIALGHRRLSILDLSTAGHQPMHSLSNRFTMVFNGEIYNHLEIRKELESSKANIFHWKGHSDSETLLAAIEEWGLEKALQLSIGMFSIALWDRDKRVLSLARDRFGEKPLYYGWVNKSFVFGSELKAIKAYPGFNNPICRRALSNYLRFMYVPAPQSIYVDIFKLEPGQYLEIGSKDITGQTVKIKKYWSLEEEIKEAQLNLFTNESEALETLESALNESIKMQMLSDVPLGAFLSGGVDSSLIVALMQKQSSQSVKTFTVAFEESEFDESPFAGEIARHLGTNHHELFVSSSEAQGVISKLPVIYDEPFADSSQIPTHLISMAAKKEVTVSLSGDAGDELFGGYNRYFWGPRIWSKISWIPFFMRNMISSSICSISQERWDILGASINKFQKASQGINRLGDKAYKLSETLNNVKSIDDLYFNLISIWHDSSNIIKGIDLSNAEAINSRKKYPRSLDLDDASSRMMFWDSLNYLPDDILCKVDRAAMACSLETRVPFLDHRVSKIAWQLPTN